MNVVTNRAIMVRGLIAEAQRAHLAGELARAEALFRQVVAFDARQVDALYGLGMLGLAADRYAEAADFLALALKVNRKHSEIWIALGRAQAGQRQYAESERSLRRALAIKPDNAQAHRWLGITLWKSGALEPARASLVRSVALNPKSADLLVDLGVVLHDAGRTDEAVGHYHRALELDPDHWRALHNLSSALHALGDHESALAFLRRAATVHPTNAVLRLNLAQHLLAEGSWRDGFREHEWRQAARGSRAEMPDPWQPDKRLARVSERLPIELAGAHLLVVADQGLGDELFFLRFHSLATSQGASITYFSPTKIAPLLRRTQPFEVTTSLPPREDIGQVLLLGDLPLALQFDGTGGLPASLDLPPDPKAISRIRERLSGLRRPLLGVTWRGGNKQPSSRGPASLVKEIDIELLAGSISAWRGDVLVLQRLPAAGELEKLEAMLKRKVHDLSPLNDSLEDMLALLALVDEYAGVSNTNMHLRAGARRTASVLVPYPAEWRWMVRGDESPWYPGFRIYRQRSDRDWAPALSQLEADLRRASIEA